MDVEGDGDRDGKEKMKRMENGNRNRSWEWERKSFLQLLNAFSRCYSPKSVIFLPCKSI